MAAAGSPDDRPRLRLGHRLRAVLACLLLTPSPGLAQDAPDILTENYRDWALICQNGATAEGSQTGRICEITQELRQSTDGQRVLRIALAVSPEAPEGSAALTLITPFGVRLADGVSLAVADDDTVARVPFLTCLAVGCIANETLSPEMMDRFAQSETAIIGMFTASGDEAQLEISLRGLSAAWRRLTALAQE